MSQTIDVTVAVVGLGEIEQTVFYHEDGTVEFIKFKWTGGDRLWMSQELVDALGVSASGLGDEFEYGPYRVRVVGRERKPYQLVVVERVSGARDEMIKWVPPWAGKEREMLGGNRTDE